MTTDPTSFYDVYTVDFREEWSALSAALLERQAQAVAHHILPYLYSKYPVGTSVILIGHSMVGLGFSFVSLPIYRFQYEVTHVLLNRAV